jgi:putative oxidoreductase
MTDLARTARPYLLSLLRIMAALLLLQHGMQKLLGFPPLPPGREAPDVFALSWFAGVIELFGGALLAVGLFSRPVAFLLSGLTAFAYWIAHAPRDFHPVLNGGELAALYCFVFLYLAGAGPGPWSLDRMLRAGGGGGARRRGPSRPPPIDAGARVHGDP